MIIDPIFDYKKTGMTALNNREYSKAIQQFSKMKSASEKQDMIGMVKKVAMRDYDKRIKNSIENLDIQRSLALIDEITKVTGETTVDKEKATIMINDEALKQQNLMFQAEKEGNYSQAKQYAERLKKLEKFKSEASNKIAFYDKKISAEMERKKAEAEKLEKLQAIKQAEEEMTKQLQAKKQAAEASEVKRISDLKAEEERRLTALKTPAVKRDIEIVKFVWSADNLELYSAPCQVYLKNNNPYLTYKDIKLELQYYGRSGTKISSHDHVIYMSIGPNQTITSGEFIVHLNPQTYIIKPVVTGGSYY